MTKLTGLVEGMADALAEEPGKMRARANALRKRRMLSTGGRGLGGAEMHPTDATNLLLAAMGARSVANPQDEVSRLRACLFWHSKSAEGELIEGPPPFPFLIPNKKRSPPDPEWRDALRLGDALDSLFTAMLSRKGLRHKDGSRVTNLTFAVRQPDYFAELLLTTDDGHWIEVKYQDAIVGGMTIEEAREHYRRSATLPPMETFRQIRYFNFLAIRDCLAGK